MAELENDFPIEDIEKQELKKVWTVGRKFMFAILGALALLITSGLFSLYYSSNIVESSNHIITHSLKRKELSLEILMYVNKHKAALAVYSKTKDKGIKTEIVEIKSKILELNTALKKATLTEEERTKAGYISELLNTTLSSGEAFLTEVDNYTQETTNASIALETIPEITEVAPAPKPKEEVVVESTEMDDLLSDLDELDDLGLDGLDDLGLDDLDLDGLDDLDLDGLDDLASLETKKDPTSDPLDDLASLEGLNEDNGNDEIDLGDLDMSSIDLGQGENTLDNSGVNMNEYNLSVLELFNSINTDIILPSDLSAKKLSKSIDSEYTMFKVTQIGLRLMLIAYFLSMYLVFNKNITKPIKSLRQYLMSLGKGELPNFKMKIWEDDIGEIAKSVKSLIGRLRDTASFANELGEGKLNTDYALLGESDLLGNAVIGMRDNLRKLAAEGDKRNWANQGIATFAEILRTNNDSIDKLTDQIILYLVNYLKINQGAIFLVNDFSKDDVHLELSAIYAWDRKKFLEQRIEKGQGLVGQSWYEQKTIYITDVPDNFINITSGLGEATPGCILIVPLIANEEVYGILEFASFKILDQYEIEFVEKVAESIAAAIGNVRISEKTKILLEEAQQQGEELRANEEEMRQNMEEMNATQEEMDRILQEKDLQITKLSSELDAFKS